MAQENNGTVTRLDDFGQGTLSLQKQTSAHETSLKLFESSDKIPKCDHSNKRTSFTFLRVVYYVARQGFFLLSLQTKS